MRALWRAHDFAAEMPAADSESQRLATEPPQWARRRRAATGRKGTGRFRISGELKLTFIGAGDAFFETGAGLPVAMAGTDLWPVEEVRRKGSKPRTQRIQTDT